MTEELLGGGGVLKQMGVGGDNSWGAKPHPQYMIPAQLYSYEFWLKPVAPGAEP